MTTDGAALRRVVAVPDFRRLLRVRLLGQLADGVFQAALFSAVFFNPERATSAPQAASSFAVLLLPYSVVGPFAGVFLDRWRRQRVLVVANLLRAALVVVFATLVVGIVCSRGAEMVGRSPSTCAIGSCAGSGWNIHHRTATPTTTSMPRMMRICGRIAA